MVTQVRTAHPHLLGLFGVGLAIFGLVVLDRSLARDTLVCDEGACVLDRDLPVPLGAQQRFHRLVRATDIKKLEAISTDAKSGDTEYLLTLRGEGEDEMVNLRFHIDARGEGDARRYFAEPKGKLALEGPRRSRDYPFAAMMLGLSASAFIAAYMQVRKQREGAA